MTKPALLLLAAAIVLAFTVTACGGGVKTSGNATADPKIDTNGLNYVLALGCLTELTAHPSSGVTDVANQTISKDELMPTPTNGAMVVTFDTGNDATLFFYRSTGDASRANAAARTLLKAFTGGPVDDILFQRNSVVWKWTNSPTNAEADTVTTCLS